MSEKKFFILMGGALAFYVLAMWALSTDTVRLRLIEAGIDRELAKRAERAADYGGDNLDIVFCGTASPMGGGDRAQQCMGVFAGDKFFVVDSGARSTAKANAASLPLGRLDGVLLTHFHSDHISGLGELHLGSWVQGRRGKLMVHGPAGVEKVVDGFNLAYELDFGYRTAHHGEKIMPSENAGLQARRFDVRGDELTEIYNENGLVISAFTVPHEPIRPAIGYRFDYRGRSVVISGDTSKTEAIVRVSKNADVLIHEVLHPELVALVSAGFRKIGLTEIGQLMTDTLSYHTSPQEVAELAQRAKVPMLVFTHFAPVPTNGLMRRMYRSGVRHYDGDLELAKDGMMIRLPVGTDDIDVEDTD